MLHATIHLGETLGHCRELLAPSGQLLALEGLRGQDWLDLTFGQLDGWWRFADDFRPRYALAEPEVWQQALGDAGFVDVVVLGQRGTTPEEMPDRGVIVAARAGRRRGTRGALGPGRSLRRDDGRPRSGVGSAQSDRRQR